MSSYFSLFCFFKLKSPSNTIIAFRKEMPFNTIMSKFSNGSHIRTSKDGEELGPKDGAALCKLIDEYEAGPPRNQNQRDKKVERTVTKEDDILVKEEPVSNADLSSAEDEDVKSASANKPGEGAKKDIKKATGTSSSGSESVQKESASVSTSSSSSLVVLPQPPPLPTASKKEDKKNAKDDRNNSRTRNVSSRNNANEVAPPSSSTNTRLTQPPPPPPTGQSRGPPHTPPTDTRGKSRRMDQGYMGQPPPHYHPHPPPHHQQQYHPHPPPPPPPGPPPRHHRGYVEPGYNQFPGQGYPPPGGYVGQGGYNDGYVS